MSLIRTLSQGRMLLCAASVGLLAGSASGTITIDAARIDGVGVAGPNTVVQFDLSSHSNLENGKPVSFTLTFFGIGRDDRVLNLWSNQLVVAAGVDANRDGNYGDTVIYNRNSGAQNIRIDLAEVPGIVTFMSSIDGLLSQNFWVYGGVQIVARTTNGIDSAPVVFQTLDGKPAANDQSLEIDIEPLTVLRAGLMDNGALLKVSFNRPLSTGDSGNDINQTIMSRLNGADFQIGSGGSFSSPTSLTGVQNVDIDMDDPQSILITLNPNTTNARAGVRVRAVGGDIRDAIGNMGADDQNGMMITACSAVGSAVDINKDFQVGSADLSRLLGDYGPCDPGAACVSDVNGDGVVNATDISRVLGAWGGCP